MNKHQLPPEAVAHNQETATNRRAPASATGSVPPAPGQRKLVAMHESEADYVDWVVAESRRLKKQNDLLRGLLLKATHELKKSNPACSEMLTSLTPARAPHPTPTT